MVTPHEAASATRTRTMPFKLIGVLASLTRSVAAAGVFAVSTFDTDYLFFKEAEFPTAVAALRGAGHRVEEAICRDQGRVVRLRPVQPGGDSTTETGGNMTTTFHYLDRRSLGAGSLLAILMAFASPPSLQAEDERPTIWKAQVDGLVKPFLENKKAVGMVVGILTPEGNREFFCYGQMKAGGPAPTTDTLFEIGSVSKPITALLLAQMVETGEVKLDDPVQRYLPKELVVPLRGKQEITLLELATHTSRLPRNPLNQQRLVNKEEDSASNPYGKYDARQLSEGLGEIQLKEDAKPAFAYSNLGMGLLGDALAHKAGMSYPELVRTRIFEPLKMKDTTASPSQAQREAMATGHTSKGKPLPPWTFQTLHGCGAICSTPNDMLALHEAWCGRTETKLRKAMQVTQEKRHPAFASTSVGLSWFVQEMSGRSVWWHNGGTTGFKMCNSFCEKPAVAVVILCNTGSDAHDDGRDFYRMGESLIRQLIEAGKKAEK